MSNALVILHQTLIVVLQRCKEPTSNGSRMSRYKREVKIKDFDSVSGREVKKVKTKVEVVLINNEEADILRMLQPNDRD